MKTKTSKYQLDRVVKRINNDTLCKFIKCSSIKKDTSLRIAEYIYKRVFNGVTQEEVSISTGKSIATIKRFEAGKCDSLYLFMYYKTQFENLPNKEKVKIPKWI